MMRTQFEKLATPGQWLADSDGHFALSALVGFLFACTGPVAIILATGARGGLSESDISSWIFGAFFLNGFFTIALCLIYRATTGSEGRRGRPCLLPPVKDA